MKIKGTCWVAETYVMAYDMVVQRFWTSPIHAEENAKWIMAGVAEEFNFENAFKDCGFTFIVAGHNFAGGGKSIRHGATNPVNSTPPDDRLSGRVRASEGLSCDGDCSCWWAVWHRWRVAI